MAIAEHPLSNSKLGDFEYSLTINTAKENEHIANFLTTFYYKNGWVNLDNKWQWKTHIYEVAAGPDADLSLASIEADLQENADILV